MSPYADVFERVEKKFRIDADQRGRIEEALGLRMRPDKRGRNLITSLYLDTPDRSLISRSTEKPLYKEKVRLRAYGRDAGGLLMEQVARAEAPPSGVGHLLDCRAAASGGGRGEEQPIVFLEVKKKFKGVVYKRRVGLSVSAARAYLGGATYEQAHATHPIRDVDLRREALCPRGIQIAREAEALMERHGWPDPSMAIACERVAWSYAETVDAAGGDPGLRITFDGSLAFCDVALPEPCWRALIPADESIMEVKGAGALPLWLVRELSACKAYSAPFSKYGTAYQLAGKE